MGGLVEAWKGRDLSVRETGRVGRVELGWVGFVWHLKADAVR